MSKGFRIFLWILLVLNVLSVIMTLIAAFLQPTLFISALLGILYVAAIYMLIRMKRMGFFIICGVNVINLLINIFAGTNFIMALFSAVLFPLLLYFLMKPNWEAYQ